MADVLLLFIIVGISLTAWKIRGITESTKERIFQYAKSNGLQILSISRSRIAIASTPQGIALKCQYSFEFSSTGNNRLEGRVVSLRGKHFQFDVPPYQVG